MHLILLRVIKHKVIKAEAVLGFGFDCPPAFGPALRS